jgi:putative Mg2+ transporter-C (MgtC) family protein
MGMNTGQQILHAFKAEFTDLGDAAQAATICFRLILAAVLAGMIGYERRLKGKPAGMRTHMLVALGSAVFIMAPRLAGFEEAAVSRIIQGLVAGIGFLGAGAIIKDQQGEHVEGLTTAASIWMTAAIGMTAGMGRGATAIISTLLTLAVLVLMQDDDPRFRGRDAKPPSSPSPRVDDSGS